MLFNGMALCNVSCDLSRNRFDAEYKGCIGTILAFSFATYITTKLGENLNSLTALTKMLHDFMIAGHFSPCNFDCDLITSQQNYKRSRETSCVV